MQDSTSQRNITNQGKPTQKQIEEYTFAAQNYVEKMLGVRIQESEDSLAFVDHYIQTVRRQGLPKEEILALIGAALGVYFGQVVLTKLAGRWYGPIYAKEESQPDPLQWRIELEQVPLSFCPVAIAIASLKKEESEEQDTAFFTPAELSDVLKEAFSRMAPVDEDYYYSLTGRMETLLYMVEILAEIIQTRRQEQKSTRKVSKE